MTHPATSPRISACIGACVGPGGAGNSYDVAALYALHRMLRDVEPADRAYVLFNNTSRIRDAKRFTDLALHMASET